MPDFTIVIAAFKRTGSLARLLKSVEIAAGNVSECPPLVISIDGGGGCERDACIASAKSFAWRGDKDVIVHDRNLGLKAHILSCGDLTARFGPIALLEEDLCLSPMALRFALSALDKYGEFSAHSRDLALFPNL